MLRPLLTPGLGRVWMGGLDCHGFNSTYVELFLRLMGILRQLK